MRGASYVSTVSVLGWCMRNISIATLIGVGWGWARKEWYSTRLGCDVCWLAHEGGINKFILAVDSPLGSNPACVGIRL